MIFLVNQSNQVLYFNTSFMILTKTTTKSMFILVWHSFLSASEASKKRLSYWHEIWHLMEKARFFCPFLCNSHLFKFKIYFTIINTSYDYKDLYCWHRLRLFCALLCRETGVPSKTTPLRPGDHEPFHMSDQTQTAGVRSQSINCLAIQMLTRSSYISYLSLY